MNMVRQIAANISRPAMIVLLCIVSVSWWVEKTLRVPEYGLVFYKMGLECGADCGNRKKMEYFQKAVHYDRNFFEAYLRLATVYGELGQTEKMIDSYRRVTELNHYQGIAFYHVGLDFFKKGDHDHALRYLLRADKIGGYPDDTDYYLARIYDEKKNYESATFYYKSMVSIHPEYTAIIFPRMVEIYDIFQVEDGVYSYLYYLRTTDQKALADEFEEYYKAAHPGEDHPQIKRVHDVT